MSNEGMFTTIGNNRINFVSKESYTETKDNMFNCASYMNSYAEVSLFMTLALF